MLKLWRWKLQRRWVIGLWCLIFFAVVASIYNVSRDVDANILETPFHIGGNNPVVGLSLPVIIVVVEMDVC